MGEILGVGVGAWPDPGGGFDLWLPVLVGASFVLIRVVIGLRITPIAAFAAVVGATLWAWMRDVIGLLPSIGVVVLVALACGEAVRAVAARRSH
jgi:hypothetical protein